MSLVRTFACEICQLQKQGTNHWYLLSVNDFGHLVVESWPASEEEAAAAGITHVCGAEHLMKLVGRWAATGKLGSGNGGMAQAQG